MITKSIIIFVLAFLFCLIIAVGALAIFFTILEQFIPTKNVDDRDKLYH